MLIMKNRKPEDGHFWSFCLINGRLAEFSFEIKKGKEVSPMIQTANLARALQVFLLMTVFLAGSSIFTSDWLHAAPKSETKVASAVAVISINKATAEELQTVRGIGPALADRIVKYRDEHGRFERLA